MAKQCNIVGDMAICMAAYNGLALKMQTSVEPPGENTTLQQFTDVLEARSELFYQLAASSNAKVTERKAKNQDRNERNRDSGPGSASISRNNSLQ